MKVSMGQLAVEGDAYESFEDVRSRYWRSVRSRSPTDDASRNHDAGELTRERRETEVTHW